MLTRHWYDRGSVGEALFQAAGAWRDPLRKQKLLFWTYELVLSEELDYLLVTLERVGKRWGSSTTLAILHTTKDPLQFLQALLALPTPTPYDPPPASADQEYVGSVEVPCEVPCELPDQPTTWTKGQRRRLWIAVQDAVKHKRSLRLLRLLGALTPQVAAKYLGYTGGEKSLYTMLEMKGIPTHASHASQSTQLPSVSVSWPQLPTGRLAARLFSVPRSSAPKGPVSPLDTKEGCTFWRRVWETVQTPEDEEAFWSTYFVDDIPDEWSATELTKSHMI